MNNKDKREYISCLHLSEQLNRCHPAEMVRIREILSKCPKSLFKYRKFDKWTFDMLKKKYVYLAPVKDLDDPFECLGDFDVTKIVNPGNKVIKNSFIDHIISTFRINVNEKQMEIIKENKDAFKPGDQFEEKRVRQALKNEGYSDEITDYHINLYKNYLNVSDAYEENETSKEFRDILTNPKENLGICALSEMNDNKVLWSLYGSKYKGYCIEYCIKPTIKARRFLFPVIYSRRPNNNVSEKWFDTMFAETNRHFINNNPFSTKQEIGPVGAIYELFCTKDIDWNHQGEWRLVGEANDHFTDVDIKAVYLGFDVAKTNEAKMIRYAKKYGFDLYKMKAPDGKKRIRFYKIG